MIERLPFNMSIKRQLVRMRDKKISHGIIQTKNLFGKPQYSLVRAKQQPMKDLFVLTEKEQNPNFTNLTNELQRVCYNGYEFEKLFEKRPEISRTVGSLPQKWGRRIGKSKEKREKIDNLFSEFGKEFHSKVERPESNVKLDTKPLQEGLSEVLEQDVSVSELAKGQWGQTYRINDGEQDYVLKAFYNKAPYIYGSPKHCHGNYSELASAVYASKNDADNYVTFYMGRFGENKDGYMLTKFLPDTEKNGKTFNGMDIESSDNFVFGKFLHKLRCADVYTSSERNRKGKKIYDFGNCYDLDAGKLDYKTCQIAKTLGKFLDTNNAKGLDETIQKHSGSKEFQAARSFLQKLINQNTTPRNYQVLEKKKDLLKKLKLDYVPDIRYILSFGKDHVKNRKSMSYNNETYDTMLNVPVEAFEELWEKYHKKLELQR